MRNYRPRRAAPTRVPPFSRGRLDRHAPSWQESRRWAAVDRDVLLWKWRGMPREAKRDPLGAATAILDEVTDEAVAAALECATGQMVQLSDAVTMMVRNLQVRQSDGSWLAFPGCAPLPQTCDLSWTATIELAAPTRPTVYDRYNPITWPDEGYPCQVCWAVGRWPWEPFRACPIGVPVESTYCAKHR